MRLPKNVKINFDAAERQGHKLVSQGCARFRCTACGQTAFLDVPADNSVLGLECPNLRVCPYCSRDKQAGNVTCLRSECQEANYLDNKARNAPKRRS